MKTILFIIPLKSQLNALSWEVTCRFLDCTLTSIEGQDNPNHHTFIVCNEAPNITANLLKTTIIETNIRINGPYGQILGRIDKQKKCYYGLLEARNLNPENVMIVDGDDILHRQVVSYVHDNPRYQGFVLSRGYRHDYGRAYLVKSLAFHQISASSVIFPFSSSDFPKGASEEDYESFYMTRKSHIKSIENDLKEKKIPYWHIPFYAAIYTRGYGDSLRDVGQRTNKIVRPPLKSRRIIDTLRKVQGRLLGRQPINEKIIHDFPGLSIKI